MSPRLVSQISEMRAQRTGLRGAVSFVPTMGALHRGHAELLRRAREQSDHVVLSIFVNPTQFGPTEDFAKYPRALEKDLELARAQGVDTIFAPSVEEIYPGGYSTYVEETMLSLPLCGAFRPGHFRGVTTVVLKLFNIVQPDLAFFGLKDAQQFYVIRKMVQDLNFPIRLVGVETVREPDGLALSSRNAYLSPEDRERAPLLYQKLREMAEELKALLRKTPEKITEPVRFAHRALEERGFRVQYLECLELPGLNPVAASGASKKPKGQEYLLASAAYLGSTRLIDNVIFELTDKA